jgi:acyl carrier protein
MHSFSPQQGLLALENLLRQGATQATVMPVDWNQWAQFHGRASRAPLLSHLLRDQRDAQPDTGESVEPDELSRSAVMAASVQERIGLLEDYLARQLARVLKIPVEEMDTSVPLNHLGIDSLMAVELRNRVQTNLGVTIPVAKLLQEPCITELGQLLSELIEADSKATDTVAASQSVPARRAPPSVRDTAHSMDETRAPSAGETLARLDELSDEEVEAMLQKLQD